MANRIMTSNPERTCLVCRRQRSKKELLRFIRNDDGWLIPDFSSRASGRGFYVCRVGGCLGKVINRQKVRLPAKFGLKGFSVQQLAPVRELDLRK